MFAFAVAFILDLAVSFARALFGGGDATRVSTRAGVPSRVYCTVHVYTTRVFVRVRCWSFDRALQHTYYIPIPAAIVFSFSRFSVDVYTASGAASAVLIEYP